MLSLPTLRMQKIKGVKDEESLFAWILSLVLVLSLVGVAGAITDGELDGDGHPMVVFLRMDTEFGAELPLQRNLAFPNRCSDRWTLHFQFRLH